MGCQNSQAQSIFGNISYFDEGYFNGVFGDFVFPDGDTPRGESVKWLQKTFMMGFNKERLTTPDLTFPVETFSLLDDGRKFVDEESADWVAEMYANKHSFFTYRSNSVDSLASCCRLRNGMDNNTFSYTLGAGGIMTGSKGVVTLNINRIVQDGYNTSRDKLTLPQYITPIVKRVHNYLKAHNEIIGEYYRAGLLTVFKAGLVDLDKQYLTIGVNGFVEGAEFLGINIDPFDEEYHQYAKDILNTIADLNAEARAQHVKFNTEFVPGESLGVKNAKGDRRDGYVVPRDCYNSYFYIVEEPMNLVDKLLIHGEHFTGACDGGSAAHINLDEHLSKEQYKKLLDVSIQADTPYFTFNIPNTVCNKCGHVTKDYRGTCPSCGSDDVDYLTRVIGYLRRVSNFSAERQDEESMRYYAKI